MNLSIPALPYLLSTTSYEEAAQKLGISAKQVYSWLKNLLFQQELTRLRNEAFAEALKTLKYGVMQRKLIKDRALVFFHIGKFTCCYFR